MARPIKETPILYGEDARRFEARMKERRRISAEERARINADYELVLGMLKRGEELKQQRPQRLGRRLTSQSKQSNLS